MDLETQVDRAVEVSLAIDVDQSFDGGSEYDPLAGIYNGDIAAFANDFADLVGSRDDEFYAPIRANLKDALFYFEYMGDHPNREKQVQFHGTLFRYCEAIGLALVAQAYKNDLRWKHLSEDEK